MQVWKIFSSPSSQQMLKPFSKSSFRSSKKSSKLQMEELWRHKRSTKEAERAIQEAEGDNRLPVQRRGQSTATQHEAEDTEGEQT